MRIRQDKEDRGTEPGPTTEDIMRSGTDTGPGRDDGRDDGRDAPVYPGEATSDRMGDTSADERGEAAEPAAPAVSQTQTGGDTEPLLGTEETEGYRRSWSDIQGRFVDDPQDAVRSADTLVAEVMQALAGTFSERKQGLEAQWDRGEQVATEDLRVALQQYRSFFNRLLNT